MFLSTLPHSAVHNIPSLKLDRFCGIAREFSFLSNDSVFVFWGFFVEFMGILGIWDGWTVDHCREKKKMIHAAVRIYYGQACCIFLFCWFIL